MSARVRHFFIALITVAVWVSIVQALEKAPSEATAPQELSHSERTSGQPAPLPLS